MTDKARRLIRTAQLLLVLAGLGLWGAARLPWVSITTFDGLGQPRTTTLSGGTWSTALIPLALRGIRYRPATAPALLRRNLLVFGLGGVIVPFPFIKLIDVIISGLGLVS